MDLMTTFSLVTGHCRSRASSQAPWSGRPALRRCRPLRPWQTCWGPGSGSSRGSCRSQGWSERQEAEGGRSHQDDHDLRCPLPARIQQTPPGDWSSVLLCRASRWRRACCGHCTHRHRPRAHRLMSPSPWFGSAASLWPWALAGSQSLTPRGS